MRITIVLVAMAAAAAVLTSAPDRAEACSCMRPPPAEASFQEAAAVFIAVPTAIERGEGIQVRVPMQVQRAYKGVETAEVEVTTARDSASCGFPFETGRPYLVYAHEDAEDGLSVSLCSRTQPLDLAQDDVAAIEAITPGTVPSGQTPNLGDKPRPPRPDVTGAADPQPQPEPQASPAPQQVEPGARGCGCRAASGNAGSLALLGMVAFGLLAGRRRRGC